MTAHYQASTEHFHVKEVIQPLKKAVLDQGQILNLQDTGPRELELDTQFLEECCEL